VILIKPYNIIKLIGEYIEIFTMGIEMKKKLIGVNIEIFIVDIGMKIKMFDKSVETIIF